MHIRLLCLLMFISTMAFAQSKRHVMISPKAALEALKTKPKFMAGFDTKRSFISSRDVSIFGIKTGLDFDGKIRLGFGIYFLSTPFYRSFKVSLPGSGGALDTIPAKLHFTFLGYFAEYIFLRSKRWELGFPLYVGIGEVNFPDVPGFKQQPLLLGQFLFRADYKIFPFFGLSGGIGYRQILAGNTVIQENFNAPIYSFGIKLWLDWFAKKIWPEKFGPVEEY